MNAPGSTTQQECINAPRPTRVDDDGPCKGPTHVYTSLSGHSRFPKCEEHYDAYVKRVQPELDRINRDYPDSPIPPAWFDPMAAGERWNDDDP